MSPSITSSLSASPIASKTGKRRAVFLDRDGVINRPIVKNGAPVPPTCADDFELLPGVLDALNRLRKAGLSLFIVTNQPDIARGTMPAAALDEIHAKLTGLFRFDGIYACVHDDADGCECRKPKPGMILQAAREHGIDPAESFLVGDRNKDMEAGKRAGCVTLFVQKSYSGEAESDYVVQDLPEAAGIIIQLCGGATA